MQRRRILPLLLLVTLITACDKDDVAPTKTYEDYSGALDNTIITLKTPDNREIIGYLSKPEGSDMDMVLALHGGSASLEASISSTKDYIEKPDGGKQFLDNGYAVLSLEYTEYETDGIKSDRGFKELIDVLAATDYILNDSLEKHKVRINKVISFGHSRGGNNALLAGIERKLHASVAAEAPLDWVKTQDSIQAGVVPGGFEEIQKFEESVSKWADDDFVKYSPGLRLEHFKTKFMIISGELDPAVLIGIAEDVKEDYENCTDCIEGGTFILHPKGHTDWATPEILDDIQTFIK